MEEYTQGFAFKRGIVNKATDEQLSKLGRGWVWCANGEPHHLVDCLTVKGWAVTPGKWNGGWKNSNMSTFWGADYVFLDFDGDVPLKEIKADPFVNSSALFLYTTASHGSKPGDRFRVVFKLDKKAEAMTQYNSILKGLREIVPGSDPAINVASCLYGCNYAEVHYFDLTNTLDLDFCIEMYELSRPPVVVNNITSSSFFTGGDHKTESNLRNWLAVVPADGYHKWMKVGAWLKSVTNTGDITDEQGLAIFTDWSIANYQGEKHNRDQPEYIQTTWERLKGGGYGLIKIKQLSELTAQFNTQAIESLLTETRTRR